MKEEENKSILNKVNYPSDIKRLSLHELETLCKELRLFLIEQLAVNPGHFASSLGTVELTVALHYVFYTPYDKILWDTGHQAYSHKILTGRKERFHTNRKLGGISGFPNPNESEYDAFVAGHVANSISAALGMAVAVSLKKENRKIVAVIGDGAMTSGLAYEAINNAASYPNNLLVIFNDNDMAIDRNVGGLRECLVKMTTSRLYNKVRNDVYQSLKKRDLISERGKNLILRFNNGIKSFFTRQQNLFEGFDIRYFGPVDGHDLRGLIRILQNIKEMDGPRMLHIHTVKGKGYKPAEILATVWHAPGRFNKDTGERIASQQENRPPLFQDVFGHTLVELADEDKRVLGITPAMLTGSSMSFLQKKYPERTFDVGIAEAHAVTYSAGLAKEGFIPFCNIYSSFVQRAYDQVIHDVALQKLHVIMCLDRAGLVGEDGPTHHGAFDMSYMRCIPNLIIASPMNEHYLRHLMFTAYKENSPFVIRYPRGQGVIPDWKCDLQQITIGKGRKLRDGNEIALLTIGPIGNDVAEAINILKTENMSIAHYDMIFLKPIDTALLKEVVNNYERVITVEEGTINGGFGSAVSEFLAENKIRHIKLSHIGLPDEFITHGTVADLKRKYKLDVTGLTDTIRSIVYNADYKYS